VYYTHLIDDEQEHFGVTLTQEAAMCSSFLRLRQHVSKEAYHMAKETYGMAKETYCRAKEAYHMPKKP
jgi:hypothetical protein